MKKRYLKAPIIDGGQKKRPKVKPCICGKSDKQSLFKTKELSPDSFDVALGSVYLVIVEGVMGYLAILGGSPNLVPLFLTPIPLIILLFALIRLVQGHKLKCSIRWAWVAVTGQSRWVNLF